MSTLIKYGYPSILHKQNPFHNNRNTRKRCEISSELKIKTTKRCQKRRSGDFIVSFDHISHLFLVFLLLTLNKSARGGYFTLHVLSVQHYLQSVTSIQFLMIMIQPCCNFSERKCAQPQLQGNCFEQILQLIASLQVPIHFRYLPSGQEKQKNYDAGLRFLKQLV